MRFINCINNVYSKDIDYQVKMLRKELKTLTKQERSKENRQKVKQIYAELNNLQFVPEYMCLIIDKPKDYDRACKGFSINGVKYKRFVGTTNGVKKETIVFVCERNQQDNLIYDELCKRVDNGRNLESMLVPAKFEAYKSLSCSSSLPVSTPNGIVVVKDCFTKFYADYINLDDTNSIEPEMTIKYKQEIELDANDGFGLITPNLAERWSTEIQEDYVFSGCCIRNSYCKGMLFPFDFQLFANTYCDGYIVTDIWGNNYDIRNIELVLTESMLKLWSSYNSLEHYLECCDKNGYSFAITKVTPKKLDNTRNLNYQFIQSYDLTDEEVYQLALPTINEIKSAIGADINKSILFLKGMSVSENDLDSIESDFIKALMIDDRMVNDPFVRGKIFHLIRKRIDQAKIGVLRVNGNYSVVSGDPFALCQSMFGLEITGILKAEECYSKYWNEKSEDRVSCFRAPMSCHNNIRVLNLNNSDKAKFWYQHMHTVFIINSWDMTTMAENGNDFDGDLFFTTNNPVLVNKTRKTLPIQCVQRSATKQIITEENLIQANKDSFGDEIGSTTNRVTTMFDVIAKFKKESLEYKTLDYRIKCGQLFQQNAIDKTKGIDAKPMPKEWYDAGANKIVDSDTEEDIKRKKFNMTILADRKPYFMNYIYPSDMFRYKNYINSSNKKCITEFRMPITSMLAKENKTEKEQTFLYYYYKQMPNGMNDCVMNKVCWLIEGEFDGYLNKTKDHYPEFDYSILKSNYKYDKNIYNKIFKLYQEYGIKLQDYLCIVKSTRIDQQDATVQKSIFKKSFQEEALSICSNKYELCDIVLDICYTSIKSKQFAWDVCGETIIENLLRINNNRIKYLRRDEDGDIEYCGEYFSEKYKTLDLESEECE
jgi:hypothetical protein